MNTLPVFVINLARQTARREFMLQQARALQVEPVIWPGVDGRSLSAEELAQHYDEARAVAFSRSLTPGEVGCALSHLGVYRHMLEQKIPCALVLEDDASIGRFTPDVLRALDEVMSTERPTVVLLIYVSHYRARPSRRLTPRHQLVRVWKGTCAHGYLINRAAADYLVRDQSPVYVCADKWTRFNESKDIDVWAVTPPCIGQSVFAYTSSALESDRRALKIRVKQRRAPLARLSAFGRRIGNRLLQKLRYGVRKQGPDW